MQDSSPSCWGSSRLL